MSIFTADEEVIRIGVTHLLLVVLAVVANGVRLLLAAGGAFFAMFWMGAGATAIFAAIALGFVAYVALTSIALCRIKATIPA